MEGIDFRDPTALLVSVCVFGSLHLVIKVIEILAKNREKKDAASERAIRELTEVVKQNTLATEHLDQRLNDLENTLSELPKLKIDMRRLFSSVKTLAGENWPTIKRKIMDEETL